MDITQRFAAPVLKQIAAEISSSGGNEVFFSGTIDDAGIVVSAYPAARGHQSAVPAAADAVKKADVLIHNHPGGNLYPSDADLSVACRAAENSQGFYIINNNATDLYVVVEPIRAKKIHRFDIDAVCACLSGGGPLESVSDSFEERPAQLALTKSICTVFNENGIGVFEAGTGVGKSFAYLVPSIIWAVTNSERVVVSTGTINLQQQLIEKDIPVAEKITGKKIKAVLMKGRQNYLCLRRLADLNSEPDLFDEEASEIRKIAEWAKNSATGSRSDMAFIPAENIWQRVNSESDACFGMRCPYRETCFVMRMRKEAADANILIVNHHLLFADIESRLQGIGYDDTAVLPPYKRLVFDEAHGIESAATSFFSESVTRFRFIKQLNVLYRQRRGAAAGLLFTLEALSSRSDTVAEAASVINGIKNDIQLLENAALEMIGTDFTWRMSDVTAPRAVDVLIHMEKLYRSVADFAGMIRDIIEGIAEEDRDVPAVWEAKQVLRRIESAGLVCRNFTEWKERSDTVFWLEKRRYTAGGTAGKSGDVVWYPRFVQTPLDIAPRMNEGIFEPLETVVCTSATLRIGTDFSFWMRRSGAAYVDETRILSGVYQSPFPYKTNTLLVVPSDIPLPDSSQFQPVIEQTIVSLAESAGGRTLVLFTSYESLRSACEAARKVLPQQGIAVLKQGDDDRFRLLEQFKNDTGSVLFATDSFWEGVDVPGESLSQVIIVKLPFSVPSDPVFAARAEAVERRGGNSFMEMNVPEAVIRFRQGFGRLIRHSDDRGVVTVLDRRIIEKRYGQIFLASLPETKRKFAPLAECISSVDHFLG